MATKRKARTTNDSHSIAQNPLFKALKGKTAPKRAGSRISPTLKSSKQAKSIKTNELAVRLGLVKGISKKLNVSAKKINPLAAALSNKPRIVKSSHDGKKDKVKPNKVARVRNSKKREEINFKKIKQNPPRQEYQDQSPQYHLHSQPTDYAVPFGMENNNTRPKYPHTAYHAIEQEKYPRNSKQQRNTHSRNNDISFRNASLIPFLRITNLEPDVTETDIRSVLTEKLGPTLKILKRTVLYENQPAVCAEVFFLKENYLQQYAAALNNIHADGRLLKAEVATKSDIIHSDKLWEGMLREVRFLKQEALTK